MKELTLQEQVFKVVYLETFSVRDAAREAGYSESVCRTQAWSWVSITGCPPNKVHLRDAIAKDIKEVYDEERIDKSWIIRRARLLVDFNLKNFMRVNENGSAVYDFSEATLDDWWCLEEFVNERTFRSLAKGDEIEVEKVRIKTASKIAALRLIGDHVDIAAFKTGIEVNGTMTQQIVMTPEEYQAARTKMIEGDDI